MHCEEKNYENHNNEITSKSTGVKSHRFKFKHNDKEKDVSDKKKSGKSWENRDAKAAFANSINAKVKYETERQDLVTKNKERGEKRSGIITNDKFASTGTESVKLKKEKKKSREYNESESSEKNAKFRIETAKLVNKTGDKRSDKLVRNNDKIVERVDNKREGLHVKNNKQDWANGKNKKTKKGNLNDWKKKIATNIRYTENSFSEKKLKFSSKVNKFTKESSNIDALLLPYVVFAQGDTYFRILPANKLPIYKGNYSLI